MPQPILNSTSSARVGTVAQRTHHQLSRVASADWIVACRDNVSGWPLGNRPVPTWKRPTRSIRISAYSISQWVWPFGRIAFAWAQRKRSSSFTICGRGIEGRTEGHARCLFFTAIFASHWRYPNPLKWRTLIPNFGLLTRDSRASARRISNTALFHAGGRHSFLDMHPRTGVI